jgi:hypothetical protein
MMTPFELNCSTFRSLYPGLTEDVISDEMLQALWGVIEALLGDGEGNFPYPETTIQTILYTALCHLATLETNGMNQPGRIASATEGSVSTSFENIKIQSEVGEWWNQTKCGALFWVLTKRYRVACRFYGGRKFHPWG